MAGTRGAKDRRRAAQDDGGAPSSAGQSAGAPTIGSPRPGRPATAADDHVMRRGRVTFLSSPVQWMAVLTLVASAAAAIIEAGRKDARSWSVFVQSAVGIAAGSLAWFLNRWGGRLGVLWGVAQAVLIAVDGRGWIGKQVVATYIGTSSKDPALASGTTIALNALGGFFACAWGWFLLKERWSTPRR